MSDRFCNLDLSDPSNPRLKGDENLWYFAGLLRGKMKKTGGIEDTYGISRIPDEESDYKNQLDYNKNDSKGITLISPDTLKAVDPDDNDFQMNIPFGISPQKVKIIKTSTTSDGRTIFELKTKDSDSKFEIRPLGNILCLKLKNNLIHSIAIPIGASSYVRVKSRYLLNTKIYLDFWQYSGERLQNMGTDAWVWHYEAGDKFSASPNTFAIVQGGNSGEGVRDWQTLAIDWKQYAMSEEGKSNIKNINGKDMVILNAGDEVNLYVWSIYNSCFMASDQYNKQKPIYVDFSGLDLYAPEYTPGVLEPTVTFKQIRKGTNQSIGYVKLYGGADNSTARGALTDKDGMEVNYLFKTTKAITNLKPSVAITIPLNIESDLMITETYFNWQSNNNGVIEIFNPNNKDIDLKDYYLIRMRYDNAWKNVPSDEAGEVQFRAPDGNDSKNLQYALLLPLDLSKTNSKFRIPMTTPASSDPTRAYSVNYDANIYTMSYYDDYEVETRLVAPSAVYDNYKISYIPKGTTFCFGGYGIFAESDNIRRQRESHYLFSTNELGNFISFTEDWGSSNNIGRMTYFWGLSDGKQEIGQSLPGNNGSANDRRSGVMMRNYNQGWALVKKMPNGKFYVLDAFGPAHNNGSVNVSKFTSYITRYGNTRMWGVRSQLSMFPNGGSMDDDWQYTNTIGISNIGSRARYCTDGSRPKYSEIPYFSGSPGK